MKHYLLCTALVVLAASLVQGGSGPGRGSHPDALDCVFLADARPVLIRLHVQIDGKPLRAAWEDCITQLFKHLDRNGDGVLDGPEAGHVIPTQILFQDTLTGNVTVPALGQLDTNLDGKVTRAELADYYRRNGGAPFQVVPTADREMLVRLERIRRLRDGLDPAQQAAALNEALFNLLDTNKDGKLSRAELAAGPALLLALDADDDEMITPRELLSISPGRGKAAPAKKITEGEIAPSSPSFLTLMPGESPRTLARQLQARYGSKAGKQGGKKLTRKDIGLDQATFDRLDVDEDGELDVEELARFAQRPADLEFVVRFGKAPADTRVELSTSKGRPAPLAASVRKESDGSILLELGTTRLQLLSRAAEPAERVNTRLREEYDAAFLAADLDSNGYLDSKEGQRSVVFRHLFAFMDRDGDGKLYPKEMRAYLDSIRELQTRARMSCASLRFAEAGRGLFDLLDTNRDGRLGVRELRQMVKLVDLLDRDGDGQLSRSEIPRTYRVLLAQGPATSSGFVRGAASPNNPRTGLAGPLWFRKMDRNRDGDVSRREFLGTDEEFRRIDLDGDELISPEEAERADALMRKQKQP